MPGAREVVGRLQERGVMVAIVSSGVDIFVGMIAAMLKLTTGLRMVLIGMKTGG